MAEAMRAALGAEPQPRQALVPEKMRAGPGFGKPLDLSDNPFDQGMGAAYRGLRTAGFAALPRMEAEAAALVGAPLGPAGRGHGGRDGAR